MKVYLLPVYVRMNHRRLDWLMSIYLLLLLLFFPIGFLEEVGITRALRRTELQIGQKPSIELYDWQVLHRKMI